MKKMLGLGAIGVVVGVLVVLGSYYGMGLGTEKILKKNIDVFNQTNGTDVVIQNYHRGWFCSHAELKWSMKVPQSASPPMGHNTTMIPNKVYTFEIPLDIHHGPVMFVDSNLRFGLGYARSKAPLPAAFEQELSEKYDLKSEKLTYSVGIMVSYLNNTTIQFIVPKYKLLAKQGNDYFQWLGFKTDIIVSSNKKRLRGDLTLDGLSWFNNKIQGELGPVKTEYDMKQGLDGLYIGKAKLNLPALEVSTKEPDQEPQQVLQIVGAQIRTESNIQNGLFNTSLSAKVNQLVLSNKSYMNNVLDISVKNLDAKVLASMNRKVRDMQRSGHSKQPAWILMPDVPALLSKGAQLSIVDFEVTMPDGHVKADVNLSLPNENMTNPFQLLQKISGESNLRLSETVVTKWLQVAIKKSLLLKAKKQVPVSTEQEGQPAVNMVDIEEQTTKKVAEKTREWIDAGILVQKGQDYLVLVKLAKGKLLINGHPFSPALLAI